MKIFVDGYLPKEWKDSLKKKIKNNDIRTWTFVIDDEYDRLLHTGDSQYNDVVLRIVGPSDEVQKKGTKYTYFEPTIRESITDAKACEIAKTHFGIVLGRFAEVLNCHYADTIKNYRTEL